MPLLIPVSEAETVVCFCFQTAPDLQLPTLKPQGELRADWRPGLSPRPHTRTPPYTRHTHSLRPRAASSLGHALLHTFVQDPTKCIADHL